MKEETLYDRQPDAKRTLRSKALDLLRFPLAVIVVFVHVFAQRKFEIEGMPVFRMDQTPEGQVLYTLIDRFIRDQSVPVYFFIAGYVFSLGLNFNLASYSKKLRNRVHSLLIPYLIWNTIAIVIALSIVCGTQFGASLNYSLDWSVTNFLQDYWNSALGILRSPNPSNPGDKIFPADVPLWFVRDLMLTVLCAPMIYIVLKRTGKSVIITLGAMWILLSPLKLGHLSQMLTAIFFFSWGAWLSFHGKDMIQLMKSRSKLAVVIYVIIGVIIISPTGISPDIQVILRAVAIICGMIMCYTLSSWLIESRHVKVNPLLAASSFFVYAAHYPLILPLRSLLLLLIKPDGFWGFFGVQICVLLLLCVGLVLIFKILGILSPQIQKLLAGRTYIKLKRNPGV